MSRGLLKAGWDGISGQGRFDQATNWQIVIVISDQQSPTNLPVAQSRIFTSIPSLFLYRLSLFLQIRTDDEDQIFEKKRYGDENLRDWRTVDWRSVIIPISTQILVFRLFALKQRHDDSRFVRVITIISPFGLSCSF